MKRTLFGLALTATVQAQLHLITGEPTPKGGENHAAALWRLSRSGELTHLKELVSEKEGLHRLDVLREAQKVVLMTKYPDVRVALLDLDTWKVVKSCSIPMDTYEWVSVQPLRFHIYSYLKKTVYGVDLESAGTCRESLRVLAPGEYALPVTEGQAGVDQIAAMETLTTVVDASGNIRALLGGTSTYLDQKIPRAFLPQNGTTPVGSALRANTSQVLVYSMRFQDATSKIAVLHRPSGRWSELPSNEVAGIRVFGKQVVVTEGHLRRNQTGKSLPAGPQEASAGEKSWRRNSTKYGTNTELILKNSYVVYGGALRIIDSESGRVRRLKTDQADSEIVLIEGETVYYRISDRLYSARLTESGLTEGRLLIQSDLVVDVHWAFLDKEKQ